MKKLLIFFFSVPVLVASLCAGVILGVQVSNLSRIHAPQNIPTKPVAIVLGASVNPNGSPSDALRDRVLTAVDLYRAGKVGTLIMSGDDGAFHVNEVAVMARTAQEAGVPANDIRTDGKGYRTYESCKRAVQELHINAALIVTQRFHLARALYLCRAFGMDAEGVIADRQPYVRIAMFWVRDLFASAKAFWDVRVWPPKSPVSI